MVNISKGSIFNFDTSYVFIDNIPTDLNILRLTNINSSICRSRCFAILNDNILTKNGVDAIGSIINACFGRPSCFNSFKMNIVCRSCRNGVTSGVDNSKIFKNNGPNFSMEGTPVSISPSGVGVLLLAANKVEIFNNRIEDFGLVGIALTHYAITGKKVNPSDVQDEEYDPRSRAVSYTHLTLPTKA